MKYMVISDIHGGIVNLNKVLNIYSKENCDKLIVLGDLFNYGIDLHRSEVINKLNMMRRNIIYVRGNSDLNVSKIEFETPSSKEIFINNKSAFLAHGHLRNKESLMQSNYDIILLGHTHIPNIERLSNKVFLNPGSISKSRRGENTFMIIDGNDVSIRNLNNEIIKKEDI